LDHGVAWNTQFTTQIEKVMLDIAEIGVDIVGQVLAAQQADGAVELVHGTQCGDPGRVLCDARAVAQPSGTVVACTGNDGGKAIADDETPFQMPAWAGPCRPMPSL